MIIERAEITLERSSTLVIKQGDCVDSCQLRVLGSKLGISHPIRIEEYGVLKNCRLYSVVDEPIEMLPHAVCIGNAFV